MFVVNDLVTVRNTPELRDDMSVNIYIGVVGRVTTRITRLEDYQYDYYVRWEYPQYNELEVALEELEEPTQDQLNQYMLRVMKR